MATNSKAEGADSPKQSRIDEYHAELHSRIVAVMSAPAAEKEQKLPRLGREFLRACERGLPAAIRIFLNEGMPVNYQDSQTGQTALHAASATRAREAVRALLATGKCDFLIRDNKGRLSSEMAYLYGRDPALARLLGNKERKQAEAQGIKLTRRPAPKT